MIFIDGTKIEANANKYTFVWRKATEKYSASLVEKSNPMYEELLEKEIIPEIERESPDKLSTEELGNIVEKLNDKVKKFDEKIEANEVGSERKQLRSARKEPNNNANDSKTLWHANRNINRTWKSSESATVTRRRIMTLSLCE